MKRYKRYCFAGIIFLALAWPSAGFSQSALPELEGKWQMDGQAVLKEMAAGDRDKYEKMPLGSKNESGKSPVSRTFVFSGDGTFKAEWVSGGEPRQVSGEYGVLAGEVLNITVNGEAKGYSIEKLTSSQLILQPRDDRRGMIKKLIFTRISE